MGLCNIMDFSSNIRTHATVVGVIFALGVIYMLLITVDLLEKDNTFQDPDDITKQNIYGGLMLAAAILQSFFTGLYWIGFFKRVRWCLTASYVFLNIVLAWQYAMVGRAIWNGLDSMAHFAILLIVIIQYALKVMSQMRKLNSDFTESQQGFTTLVSETTNTKGNNENSDSTITVETKT